MIANIVGLRYCLSIFPCVYKLRTLYEMIVAVCVIRFTTLPTHKHPQGSSPHDISRHHMDLTYTLTSMLTSCYDNSMLSWILAYVFITCISC